MSTSIQNINKVISETEQLLSTLRGINQYGDNSPTLNTLIRDLDKKLGKAQEHRTEILAKIQEEFDHKKLIFEKCKEALQELSVPVARADDDSQGSLTGGMTASLTASMTRTKVSDRVLVQRFGKDLLNSTIFVDDSPYKKSLCLHFYPAIGTTDQYRVNVGFADVHCHRASTQIWFYTDLSIKSMDDRSVISMCMNLHTVDKIGENSFTTQRDDDVKEHLVFVDDCWEDVLKIIGI